MRGTGMEKKVEIFGTNITDKTKCKSIIAKKWKKKNSKLVGYSTEIT
jgi:hypothetical protein